MKTTSIAFICMAALVISCSKNDDVDEIKKTEGGSSTIQTSEAPDPSTIQTSEADSELIRGKWQFYVYENMGNYFDFINYDDICEFGKGNSWTISKEYEDKDNLIQSTIKTDGRYVLLTEEGLLQLYKRKTDNEPYKTYYYKTDGNFLFLSKNNKDFNVYEKIADGSLPYRVEKRTEELYFAIYTKWNFATVINSISNKEELIIPSHITYRGVNYVVTDISSLKEPVSMFYGGSFSSISIPNTVISLSDLCFSNCKNLEAIEIPNSVKNIGSKCFSGAENLTSVTLPEGLTSIEEGTFSYCSHLKSIALPSTLQSIGNNAFYACPALTSISIPDKVTSIGRDAFYGCIGLTSVSIGNSVTNIVDHAFDGCRSLTSVIIGNSVTSIGYYAFHSCHGLTSVTIPNSVTSIGISAFADCSGLTSVTIPNSVTSIGGGVFSGCSGLTSVTIPNSVTSIVDYAFYGCSSLTSVIIPNSVTSIGISAFGGCSSLTSVNIPNSVTSIGNDAFEGCGGLTSVTIPNSVTSIGNDAFEGCGITTLTIGSAVKTIGWWAFGGNDNLETVYCKADNPPVLEHNAFDFDNYYTDRILYVPSASVEKYKASEFSSYFKKIVPFE